MMPNQEAMPQEVFLLPIPDQAGPYKTPTLSRTRAFSYFKFSKAVPPLLYAKKTKTKPGLS
jgi:hypothetical protein